MSKEIFSLDKIWELSGSVKPIGLRRIRKPYRRRIQERERLISRLAPRRGK